jgi:hypothetical protein
MASFSTVFAVFVRSFVKTGGSDSKQSLRRHELTFSTVSRAVDWSVPAKPTLVWASESLLIGQQIPFFFIQLFLIYILISLVEVSGNGREKPSPRLMDTKTKLYRGGGVWEITRRVKQPTFRVKKMMQVPTFASRCRTHAKGSSVIFSLPCSVVLLLLPNF